MTTREGYSLLPSLALFAAVHSAASFGAAAKLDGTVIGAKLTYNYGGCLARVETTQAPAEFGLNCVGNEYTFDCLAQKAVTMNSGGRLHAQLKYQQAQIALINEIPVQIVLLDNDTHAFGNVCYISSIELKQ